MKLVEETLPQTAIQAGDDRELLRRVACGDPDALWEVWQRHRPGLYRRCLHWMNGRVEDAQDALGSALLKASELLPSQAAGVLNVGAWLARVAHNVCMDVHRERGRQFRLAAATGGLDAVVPGSPVERLTPERELLRSEAHVWVRRALCDLPASLRQPVMLRFFGELSHSEIAHRLKLNPDSVRKRIQYARSFLGRRLQPYLAGDGRPAADPAAAPPLPERSRVRPATSRDLRRLDSLRRYVERHPRGRKKRLELARLLHSLGRREDALRELRQARAVER